MGKRKPQLSQDLRQLVNDRHQARAVVLNAEWELRDIEDRLQDYVRNECPAAMRIHWPTLRKILRDDSV